MRGLYEICGCLHIHFHLPSGKNAIRQVAAEAERAGLDFVILSSHTPGETVARRYQPLFREEFVQGNTCVLFAEEADERAEHSHLLVFNVSRWTGRRPLEQVLSRVKEEGGFAFIAHPEGTHRLFGGFVDHRWKKNHLVPEVAGVEVWSLLFDWAGRTTPLNLVERYFGFPDNLCGPGARNLRLWDTMAQERPAAGVAGLDIHPVFLPWLDVKRNFRYQTVFGVLRNHLLLRRPLSGTLSEDKQAIYAALRQGTLFFANDHLADSRGFFFGAPDGSWTMGEQAPAGSSAVVSAPQECTIRLIRNGAVIRSVEARQGQFRLEKEGVFRVECLIEGRPWLFSNHIRVGNCC